MESFPDWLSIAIGLTGLVIAGATLFVTHQSSKVAIDASKRVSFKCWPADGGRSFRIRNTGSVRVALRHIIFDESRPMWREYLDGAELDPDHVLSEDILTAGTEYGWIVKDRQEITIIYSKTSGRGSGKEKIWTGFVQSRNE